MRAPLAALMGLGLATAVATAGNSPGRIVTPLRPLRGGNLAASEAEVATFGHSNAPQKRVGAFKIAVDALPRPTPCVVCDRLALSCRATHVPLECFGPMLRGATTGGRIVTTSRDSQRVLSQSILPPPAQDKPNSKKLEAIGYKDMDVDMTQEDVRILPNPFVLE
jgi:hypothetical protein